MESGGHAYVVLCVICNYPENVNFYVIVRLPDNNGPLVIKFWGSQKLYTHLTAPGAGTHNSRAIQGSTYVPEILKGMDDPIKICSSSGLWSF